MDSQTKSNATALSIISSGIIGALFLYLSSNEKHYESTDCVDLRNYAHYYGIFSVAIAIFALQVYLASLIFKDASCFSGLDCLQLLFGVIGSLFFILFAVALYKHEPCGHLRIFTLIYLLFMSIILCCQFGLISMTLNNKEKNNE